MSYYAACVQLAVDDSEIAAATLAENMTFDAVQVSVETFAVFVLVNHEVGKLCPDPVPLYLKIVSTAVVPEVVADVEVTASLSASVAAAAAAAPVAVVMVYLLCLYWIEVN